MKFKDIQVGDKVVLELGDGLRRSSYFIAEVTRLTKTLVIVGDRKFNRKNGEQYPRATGWSIGDCIYHVTDEMLEMVEKTKLKLMAHKLKAYDYHKLVNDNPELLKEIFNKLIS